MYFTNSSYLSSSFCGSNSFEHRDEVRRVDDDPVALADLEHVAIRVRRRQLLVRDRREEALVVGLVLVRHDLDEEREQLDPLAEVAEVILVERRELLGQADVHRGHHDALEDVDRDRCGRAAQRDDLRDRLEQTAVVRLLRDRLALDSRARSRRRPARRSACCRVRGAGRLP